MKYLFLCLVTLLVLGGCTKSSESSSEVEPTQEFFGGKVVLPAKTIPEGPEYDPDLLIPVYSRKAGKWGYITRENREQITPFIFWRAARMQNGFALAVELLDEGTRADIHMIKEDGTWGKVYEGEPGQTMDKDYFHPRRMFDDYFYLRQGHKILLFNPQGKQLWETTVSSWDEVQGGGPFPNYLGHGYTLTTMDGKHQIRDTSFRIVKEYDTLRYGIKKPMQMYDWIYSWPNYPAIMIVDVQEKKIGLIDYQGNEVVPLEWDWWPRFSYQTNSKWGRNRDYAMTLTRDSLFCGYRDSTWHLVHANKGVIYTYPDTIHPIHPDIGYLPDKKLVIGRTNYATKGVLSGLETIIHLDKGIVAPFERMYCFLSNNLIHVNPGKRISHEGDEITQRGKLISLGKNGEFLSESETEAISVQREINHFGFWVSSNQKLRSSIIDENGINLVPFMYEGGGARGTFSSFDYMFMSLDLGEEEKNYVIDKDGNTLAGPLLVDYYGGEAGIHWMNSDNWGKVAKENALIDIAIRDSNGYHKGYIDLFGDSFIEPLD